MSRPPSRLQDLAVLPMPCELIKLPLYHCLSLPAFQIAYGMLVAIVFVELK